MTVETLFPEKEKIEVSVRNTLLFAGYRISSPNAGYEQRAEEAAAEISQVMTPKACMARVEIEDRGADYVDILGMHLISAPLADLLSPCDEVFLFAVTAGPAVDRAIARAAASGPVDNVLTDAAGSAAAEGLCDEVVRLLSERAGLKLCQRFSPGYSGLSIDCQKDFLRLLDTQRRIGLSQTEGGMMTPVKSVTAISGIPRIAGTEKYLYY